MRVSYRFDVSAPSVRLVKFAALLGGGKVTTALLTSSEHLIVPRARRNLTANKSIFEGNLFRSLSSRKASSFKAHFIEVGTFGIEYGLNVEKGTPSGLTLTDDAKLLRWVRLKLRPSNPWSAAKAVKRKIETTGTTAKPFLFPAWRAVKDRYFGDVTSRLTAMLRRA